MKILDNEFDAVSYCFAAGTSHVEAQTQWKIVPFNILFLRLLSAWQGQISE